MTEKRQDEAQASDAKIEKQAYEAPKVESVKLTKEAAEALT